MPNLFFEDFDVDTPLPDAQLTVSGEEARRFSMDFGLPPAPLVDYGPRWSDRPVSEWFTAVLGMRLLVEALLGRSASLGAPGVEEVEWGEPVRVGDRLRFQGRVIAIRPSRSRPDMGLVTVRFALLNQHDQRVMTQGNVLMIGRRAWEARP